MLLLEASINSQTCKALHQMLAQPSDKELTFYQLVSFSAKGNDIWPMKLTPCHLNSETSFAFGKNVSKC